jgi:TrmH family RNA methyltransferase
MISSSQIKLIRSLSQKKYRDRNQLYLMEGEKLVKELTGEKAGNLHRLKMLVATGTWIEENQAELERSGIEALEAGPSDLKKASNLVTPPQVLALVHMRELPFDEDELTESPVLAFESIRDPGNLGTIIRTADWFGIGFLICTPDSTDVYNPKVVQSTMGAITRMKVLYSDIKQVLDQPRMKSKTIYGTFLDGENLYETEVDKNPLILFGNESHGLSDRFDSYIRKRLSIPSFSTNGAGSESLNVASSVAVFCSEIRR